MRLLPLICFTTVVFSADYGQESIEFWNKLARKHLQSKLDTTLSKLILENEDAPRNVILFIGDGMGIATITAARIARNQDKGVNDVNQPFFFENFPFSGLARTSSFDTHTTDSAASAVALTSGRKVEQHTLGRKPGYGKSCEFGERAKIRDGIADLAVARGIDVGFATTASITDATPASLYAKDVHRKMEFDTAPGMNGTKCIDIASQILVHPADKFKVMMGGGHAQFLPDTFGGNRTDNRSVEEEWKNLDPMHLAKSRVLLTDNEEFVHHTPQDDQQLLGIFSPLHFPYHLDEKAAARSSVPRLSEMAVKSVQVLQQQTETKGYFLMIEGAMIDKAQHKNQFHLATEEMNEFDLAIKKVSDMVGNDTLIIVTADHAHALTIPGYLEKNHSIYERDGNVTQIFFATGPGFGDGNRTNYTVQESMDEHFMQPSAIYNKDGRHGGEDVGVWSKGPYAWLFSGTMENTQIAYNIKYLMCLDDEEANICDLNKSISDKLAAKHKIEAAKLQMERDEGQTLHLLGHSITYKTALLGLLFISIITTLVSIVLIILLIRSCMRNTVTPNSKA